jgi:hypothetical protein
MGWKKTRGVTLLTQCSYDNTRTLGLPDSRRASVLQSLAAIWAAKQVFFRIESAFCRCENLRNFVQGR